MVQRHMLQCGLCWSKEKCLKPGLKCVNRWSSSTVLRKRVPESWSSNRETTSSSVQVVRRNWQKLLCVDAANETDCMGWSDQQDSLAVEKRSPDNKVWRVWNWSAARLAVEQQHTTNDTRHLTSIRLQWVMSPRLLMMMMTTTQSE